MRAKREGTHLVGQLLDVRPLLVHVLQVVGLRLRVRAGRKALRQHEHFLHIFAMPAVQQPSRPTRLPGPDRRQDYLHAAYGTLSARSISANLADTAAMARRGTRAASALSSATSFSCFFSSSSRVCGAEGGAGGGACVSRAAMLKSAQGSLQASVQTRSYGMLPRQVIWATGCVWESTAAPAMTCTGLKTTSPPWPG